MDTMGTELAPSDAVRKYNELVQESQRLVQKVAELEMDRNEHKLVEETLKPLNPNRRAYRLVGEVLVERTVEEVLPSVASNHENVCRFCCRRTVICASSEIELMLFCYS